MAVQHAEHREPVQFALAFPKTLVTTERVFSMSRTRNLG